MPQRTRRRILTLVLVLVGAVPGCDVAEDLARETAGVKRVVNMLSLPYRG